MSSLAGIKLKDAIPIIENLFDSFGIKAMVTTVNNEWVNVTTVVYLSRKKLKDLESELRLLEQRLEKIDEPNFKIILQARPIADLRKIIAEIETGTLTINGIEATILSSCPDAIMNRKFGAFYSMQQLGEDADYSFYSATLPRSESPIDILTSNRISPTALGFQDFDELVRSWIGLESFQNQPTTFFIVVPIYAAITGIQYSNGNDITISVKIHDKLFENTYLWVTRKHQFDRSPVLDRKRYDLSIKESIVQEGFVYSEIKHSFTGIGPNDKITVSLSKTNLNLLAKKDEWVAQFPSTEANPFLRAFSTLDAGKNMESRLLNPEKSDVFVTSVSWLLELIHFSAIVTGPDESVRVGKTVKGSADILACYTQDANPPKEVILAIDCTIGVPDEPKIDKIRNTAIIISEKIGYIVTPLIVTSEYSLAAKELGQKFDVKIIDRGDLEKILSAYKKGFDYPARNIILGS